MFGTITFKDEFTVSQVSEATGRLMNAVKDCEEVTVDMEEVEKVDVAAMQMLVAAKKECEKAGHRLIFKVSAAGTNLMSSMGIRL